MKNSSAHKITDTMERTNFTHLYFRLSCVACRPVQCNVSQACARAQSIHAVTSDLGRGQKLVMTNVDVQDCMVRMDCSGKLYYRESSYCCHTNQVVCPRLTSYVESREKVPRSSKNKLLDQFNLGSSCSSAIRYNIRLMAHETKLLHSESADLPAPVRIPCTLNSCMIMHIVTCNLSSQYR